MEQNSSITSNKKAALVSVISNSSLILLKLIISFLTGSISILSEALHSLSDLFASVITFFSVKYSETPPDEKHPYGHGRIENVTASVEAILIIVAAIYIFFEAFIRFLHPAEIQLPFLGIIIMSISFISNLFVSNYLYKIAKKTKSLALEGDALHLKADMFSSLAMIAGFVLIWVFDWHIIDSIFAFAVAIYMLIEGYILFKKSFNPLMDQAIEKEELKAILSTFEENKYQIHDLKTRKSGNTIFADVHLELPPQMPLQEVHDICDKIEILLSDKLPGIIVNIHVEPNKI
ncbi:MAG TPA: cation diffusion facilitator family transporter [Bacteroidales bacterium]|nr:cation transporter [Bacteroidales bacterium]HNV95088.1 cation diffusion facilitator family transporter [Bacteroidales bacterium]HOU97478.1 cation diffusion facilitator family transporter [Bacteroidales bacterium]